MPRPTVFHVIKLGDGRGGAATISAKQVYLDRFKGSIENPADAQILADPAAHAGGERKNEHVQAIEEIVAELP